MTQKEYDEIRESLIVAFQAEIRERYPGPLDSKTADRILATLDDAVSNNILDGTIPSVVVIGSPVDGFNFYGPFDDHEEAMEWAENECRGSTQGADSWWVVMLTDHTAQSS